MKPGDLVRWKHREELRMRFRVRGFDARGRVIVVPIKHNGEPLRRGGDCWFYARPESLVLIAEAAA